MILPILALPHRSRSWAVRLAQIAASVNARTAVGSGAGADARGLMQMAGVTEEPAEFSSRRLP